MAVTERHGPAGGEAMSKGKETRQAILEQSVDLASEVGLEGLTVGVLAKRVGMSKSGLYAHFASKENLQIQVIDAAADRFIDLVITPALKQPRGLPRIETLFERWLWWEAEGLSGGCLFVAAAIEFDDRDGPVRERIVGQHRDMLGAIARAARIAKSERHFRDDLDANQFAFELWGLLMAFHSHRRLLRSDDAYTRARNAFQRLIQDSRNPS